MQNEIRHTWQFNKPPQQVWEYLTRPELIQQWLMETDFQPVVGHKFSFTCGTITYCEVLQVIPNQLLSYSWKEKNDTGETTVDSKVTWTLLESNGGTELQLVHDGFTTLEDYIGHNNAWAKLGPQFVELVNNIIVK